MLRTSSRRWDKGRKTAVHGALAEISHTARAAAGRSGASLASAPRASALIFRGVVLMLVTSIAAGAAFATQDALPDSPLHDVKIATEQVRLSLAHSSQHLVAVELDIAHARLREAAALQAQDRQVEAAAAVSAYGEHVANAAAHFGESATSDESAAVKQFRAQVIKQQQAIPFAAKTGAAASATALGIAAEVAAAIRLDDQAGAEQIAVFAANAADKAATNIEKKAVSNARTAPSAPVAPSTDTVEVPPASAPESTAPSSTPITPSEPSSDTPAPATSAPAATTSPEVASAARSSTPEPRVETAEPATTPEETKTTEPAETAEPAKTAETTKTAAPAKTAEPAKTAASAKSAPQARSSAPAKSPAEAKTPAPAAESERAKSDKAKAEAVVKAARDAADRAKQAADRAKQAAQKTGRDAERGKQGNGGKQSSEGQNKK